MDLNQKPFDPKDFTGKGVEGGIATGVTGGTGPVDVKSEVYMSTEIDDPASVVSVPTPRYPPAMQSAGIAGQVKLEFIVDQTGHAEPNSIKVVSSTNKQFEESAREAVLKAVFRPGKNKGQPIRQLVSLPIVFKL